MKFWKKCYSVGFLLILSPFKINIKHCATEFQLCKQQRPEDIGSQVVDIYPNWVKVSMFLAAYLYALPTNFLFDFHTSPLISPHISKMHTGKHSSIFAWFCLIQNIFQEAGMLNIDFIVFILKLKSSKEYHIRFILKLLIEP